MRYLTFVAAFVCCAFFQTDGPSTEVDGLELRVVKCQGQKSNGVVHVEFLFINKGEFERKVAFSAVTFTDPDGNQHMPVGRYTAYLFGGTSGIYSLKPGIPTRSQRIEIKNISSRYPGFAQVSVTQKINGRTAMDVNNVPIVWR